MRKHLVGFSGRRFLLAFLTSACQFILFAPIFIIYMTFIPWPPIAWVLIVPYMVIPIFSAFSWCYLRYRFNFNLESRNKLSNASAYRLAIRLMSVFCLLLIGVIVSKNRFVPIFVSDFLNNFGEIGSTFKSLLINPFFYLIVAIFPIVFALVEYLFVAANIDYSVDS